ncbi:MAG: hypothetical protein P8Y06_00185, partial [Patescibacteria group bacterium]
LAGGVAVATHDLLSGDGFALVTYPKAPGLFDYRLRVVDNDRELEAEGNVRVGHGIEARRRIGADRTGNHTRSDSDRVRGQARLEPRSSRARNEPVLQAGLYLPMHFKTPKHNPQTFSKLATEEPFLKELGLPVEKLNKLTVSVGSIGEDQKIILLEAKQ